MHTAHILDFPAAREILTPRVSPQIARVLVLLVASCSCGCKSLPPWSESSTNFIMLEADSSGQVLTRPQCELQNKAGSEQKSRL
jgi:hypothetical protein